MININFLKYFHDVAELKSVSKAAKLNFVTQAAISQGIAKLESELGIQLMLHKRNMISITKHGEFIFQNSKSIFMAIKNFEMTIQSFKPEDSQKIRIGTSQSLATIFLPKVLKKFKQKYPLVTIELKLGKTTEIKKMILEEKIDFGIVVQSLDLSEDLEMTILFDGNFRLFKSQITNQVYVTESRPEVEFFKNQSKISRSFYKYQQIESWSVIYQLCKSGLGMGLLPDFMLDDPMQYDPIYPYKIVAFSRFTAPSGIISDFFQCL